MSNWRTRTDNIHHGPTRTGRLLYRTCDKNLDLLSIFKFAPSVTTAATTTTTTRSVAQEERQGLAQTEYLVSVVLQKILVSAALASCVSGGRCTAWLPVCESEVADPQAPAPSSAIHCRSSASPRRRGTGRRFYGQVGRHLASILYVCANIRIPAHTRASET